MGRILLGPHAVREALRARRDIAVIYLADGKDAQELTTLARQRNVEVVARSRDALEALAEGGRHQGVIAVAGEYPYVDLATLSNASERALILLLDGVQDPHNLGALIRSACVLGAKGVVIPRDRAAKVTPAVVRASAGATEHVPIALVTNVARTVRELRDDGFNSVAAVMEGGHAPWQIDFKQPTVLVIGGEGLGVRRLVAEQCDQLATIPNGQGSGRDSAMIALNASVAGAVLLYEVMRQRTQASR